MIKQNYKIYILIISFLLFNCSENQDNKPDRYSIVFGISDYGISSINLTNSADDADTVANIFMNKNYNVILYKNKEASVKNLKISIREIENQSTKSDIIVFYFSGHGIDYNLMSQVNNNFNKDWSGLLLSNTGTPNSLGDYINHNAVSNDSLFQWFEQIQGTKVFILDACFSGGFINNSVIVDNTPDNFIRPDSIKEKTKTELIKESISNYINAVTSNYNPHNGIILSSSGSRELSWDGFFGNSVFTYFFKNGVGYCDYNNDGLETVLEMYIYVKEGVKKYWNMQEADSSWNFMPHISAHPADVVLFNYRETHINNTNNRILKY